MGRICRGVEVGLALSFAVEMVERFGYFLLGGVCGVLASNTALQLCLQQEVLEGVDLRVLRIIVLITCSLGTGGVLAWLNRPFAMALSAFAGGYMLVAGLNLLRRPWVPLLRQAVSASRC